MSAHQYHEVRIWERVCFISDEDFRVFYGLAGNVTGRRKRFAELPDDAFIVRAMWERKKSRGRCFVGKRLMERTPRVYQEEVVRNG